MNYLIGHLVGDYLLQNDWMAMNKKKNTNLGWLSCFVHCFLYTVAVALFPGWRNIGIFVLVFASHMVLDKTMLVVRFMELTGSFRRIISDKDNPSAIWAYAIVDNTFHLVSLWWISKIAS